MEHIHNDELRQRLANAERDRDRLAGENLRLVTANAQLRQRLAKLERERELWVVENLHLTADKTKLTRQLAAERTHTRELNEMLAHRVGQYLELKAVLDLRHELGAPDAIRGFYSSPEGPS